LKHVKALQPTTSVYNVVLNGAACCVQWRPFFWPERCLSNLL